MGYFHRVICLNTKLQLCIIEHVCTVVVRENTKTILSYSAEFGRTFAPKKGCIFDWCWWNLRQTSWKGRSVMQFYHLLMFLNFRLSTVPTNQLLCTTSKHERQVHDRSRLVARFPTEQMAVPQRRSVRNLIKSHASSFLNVLLAKFLALVLC